MEPERAEQQQACSNCSNLFPQDKIDLHEAYCIRNMRKCQLCCAFIDIREMQHHHEANHQKKPCQWCKEEQLPEKLNDHQTVCSRRPKVCQFCQTQIAYNEHERHEVTCGSRTRPCTFCQNPIILRDVQTHEQRCQEMLAARAQQRAQQRMPPLPERLQHAPSTRETRPERDFSTNMLRHADSNPGGDRSLSSNRLNDKVVPKKTVKGYTAVIPAEHLKKVVDILPISVKLTIKNKNQTREPLRNRN